MMLYKYPSVLTIAGSDSGGGAGIQADLKTISALGCFGTTAITAITVQNTCGVTAIHNIPAATVDGQIKAVLTDIIPAAIKIGMVPSLELIKTIAKVLKSYPEIPVILDPLMVASSGDKLIQDVAIKGLIRNLFPLSALITPNLDEAAILADMPVQTIADMRIAGAKIMDLGCKAVLLKGGHLNSPQLTSLYFTVNGIVEEFTFNRVDTNNTHGTGCTLSSAIASFIAQGLNLREAIVHAQAYVNQAIIYGKDVKTGMGNGPLNHFFKPQELIKTVGTFPGKSGTSN